MQLPDVAAVQDRWHRLPRGVTLCPSGCAVWSAVTRHRDRRYRESTGVGECGGATGHGGTGRQDVIDEAKKATEEGKEKTIIFNYSGHGLMDLAGYQAFFAGELENYPLPPEVMERSIAVMEGLPKPA